MGVYTFTLEKYHIDTTRSRDDDTNNVVFGLRVGGHGFTSLGHDSGDVDDGDHGVGLVFDRVVLAHPLTPAAINYQIFNGNAGKLSVSMPQLSADLGEKAMEFLEQPVEQADPADYTDWAAARSGTDSDYDGELNFTDGSWIRVLQLVAIGSFLFPNCDGYVAVDALGRVKASWDHAINSGGGTYRQTIRYPGTESPAGCGSNSDYTVTWSVTRRGFAGPGPHSLRQFLRDHQLAPRPGLRSVAPGNKSISVRALMY